MLSKAQVLKARKAIERMYTGTCKVTEHQKVKSGASKLVTYADKVVLDGQPCRLSVKTSEPARQTESVASIAQAIKLFLAPEITVRPGSKVTVAQDGVTADYRCSGVPAVYPTHQEIVLELFERWA
ncbi:hypothetical protein [uncultured Acetatifactor sp.]|uniref:hypothetical protein n=1 Tax=uncultured Acetatifactor sp. TaxID=1671927 RepID=UPI00260D2B40|nr:hypothetical protein [uncultured Acetatifactor sp.]